MRIDNTERTRLFGQPCVPADHRTYQTPWGLNVKVHKLVAVRLAQACVEAKRASNWRPQRIDHYACRNIRGGSSKSIHSWAMAWDFFATPPGVVPPGGVYTPDNPPDAKFIDAFVRHGFFWGGHFSRVDLPHIEWADRPPSVTKQEVHAVFDNHRFASVIPPSFDAQERLAFYSWDPSTSAIFAWNGAPGPVLNESGQAKARAAGGIRALFAFPDRGWVAVVGNPGENSTWGTWASWALGEGDRQ